MLFAARVSLLPRDIGLEILFTENLVAEFPKAAYLVVVNRDENRPIVLAAGFAQGRAADTSCFSQLE